MFINQPFHDVGQFIIFHIFVSVKKKVLNIKEYIKDLLFTNQGVIVPGLGGFVSEYEPAAFDVSENKFLPPTKKITFNPEYSYQDNLLSEYIANKEKIDITEARKQIDDFVKDTQFKLKKGETIDFPEIGKLSQSSKGQISFAQNKESNLLTDSFGLTSVKAKQNTIPKSDFKKVKPKKSYKKLIIISSSAAVFLLLVASGWYFTNGFSDFKIFTFGQNEEFVADESPSIENTENNLDSIARADSLKALIVHSIDDNTDKKDALFYEELPKEEPKPVYSEFHIIAGSFKRMENAEKFSNELRSKGYSPEIIKSGEELIRISIFSYNNESEALKKLYKLREASDIKSVWILKFI